MKSTCVSLVSLLLLAPFCLAADNPAKDKNVVYLGGEMNKAPAEWIGKNVADILPTGAVHKIVIFRSMSSAPLAYHEAALGRLWTAPLKVITVRNPKLDAEAWFDAVVVLKSGDYVRVTFWNEYGRFVTTKGIGFFNQKEIYVQPKEGGK
jgi:hypothetical protein